MKKILWFLRPVDLGAPGLVRRYETFFSSGEAVLVREDRIALVVHFQLDGGEHDRRARTGVARALLDKRELAALWELPVGLAIPDRVLPTSCRRILGHLPDDLVDKEAGTWIRIVKPPVRILAVGGPATPWRSVASALGAFVTVAPRWALVRPDRVSNAVKLEASIWGIGLVEDHPSALKKLSDAARCVPELGAYQWWLAERVYDEWLRQTRTTAEPRRRLAG